MEPILAKEASSLLDRVQLFAIHNERDGSLQRAMEDINMVKGFTTRSKKQTTILIFFFHNLI